MTSIKSKIDPATLKVPKPTTLPPPFKMPTLGGAHPQLEVGRQ